MLEIRKGNLFQSSCNALVNPINCFGVMGSGLAYEFRLRYPEMYQKYVKLCEVKQIQIGKLWIYNASDGKIIVNFPTKYHWKYPSKIEYLEKGLQNFLVTYKQKGITSVAFPVLGAENGKIPLHISLEIMKKFLENLDIKVEIYIFDKDYPDDLLPIFKTEFESLDLQMLTKTFGFTQNSILKIKETLKETKNLSAFVSQSKINKQKFEKLFQFVMEKSRGIPLKFTQGEILFD